MGARTSATDKDKQARADAVKDRIRVRATRTGYYEHIRRREGDVFTLIPRRIPVMDEDTGKPIPGETRIYTAREQFSENWMEFAPAATRETLSTSKQHITKEHDAIIREKLGLEDPGAGEGDGQSGEGSEGSGEGAGSFEVL